MTQRAKPSAAMIAQHKADLAAGRISRADLAASYGVSVNATYHWIPSSRRPIAARLEDPAGFQRDIHRVARGELSSSACAAAWDCSVTRIRIYAAEARKRAAPMLGSQPSQRSQRLRAAEAAKRNAVAQELRSVMAQGLCTGTVGV